MPAGNQIKQARMAYAVTVVTFHRLVAKAGDVLSSSLCDMEAFSNSMKFFWGVLGGGKC
jgi:hypothetical protein